MVTYFEEEDLVSFGGYLLSEERKKSILEHPEFKDKTEEDLKIIYQIDLLNWSEIETRKRSTKNT